MTLKSYDTADLPRNFSDLFDDDKVTCEILNIEKLEQLAFEMGLALKINKNSKQKAGLLFLVKNTCDKLLTSYLTLTKEIGASQGLTPAAEWFLDNFHIVEDQLRSIKRDLPKDFYNELPKIKEGEFAGHPRVYAIAQTIVAQVDSRLEIETIIRFVNSFQKSGPLTIGELWAIAITLRIALIQRLGPIVDRIIYSRQKRTEADQLADQLLEFAIQPKTKPEDLVEILSKNLNGQHKYNRPFIVQLIQRLRDQDPSIYKAIDWLEETLRFNNTSTTNLTQFEHFRQAADQVTVGNIISSMRLFSTIDWHGFFENVSLVDPVLEIDPLKAYGKMDRATKDTYRKAIERIAKRSSFSERDVAQAAIKLANDHLQNKPFRPRVAHVGYYLLDEGVKDLENTLNYRSPFLERLVGWIDEYPVFVYFSLLCFLTAIFLTPLLNYFITNETQMGTWKMIGFVSLVLVPVSELALGLLNYSITLLRNPNRLPRMDTEKGITHLDKTMVVVPCLLINENTIQDLVNNLEVQYLANQDPYISFALLADFRDASTQTTSDDKELLEMLHRMIASLNQRYSKKESKIFYAFYRSRLFNPSEGKWMGWERKRGKILEFNRLIRGDKKTSYLPHEAEDEFLHQIRYVITLDADTQLPLQNARRLIGTIAHPLNQPVYCPKEKRIVAGYGIIQPRISVSLVSAAQTHFSRIFSGNTGIDPYTTAVSDIYQDFFKEGTYTGKGLYDVDAFEQALGERVPENHVLSHDLFEGSYARVGLATDIELIDDYPSDFLTFSKRLHRWTRGDWQIAYWLFPKVPNYQNEPVRNNLPLMARFKIFDNLRRSLLAPTVLIWLILSWSVMKGSPLIWTLAIVGILSFSVYAPSIRDFINRHEVPLFEHLQNTLRQTKLRFDQILMMLVFMPTIAFCQVDAITRSLYRMFISKKNLLEWVSFSQIQNQNQNHQKLNWKEFISAGPILAFLCAFLLLLRNPSSLIFALPFLTIWVLAPLISYLSKQRPKASIKRLGESEVQNYRRYARMTWHFFEKFVGDEDHWLAPDNFQEDPHPVVAHRTSPTNIGLQLLSTVSAYDFGYLGAHELVERLEKTMQTLGRLERMNGHFFNWYNTKTLEPLHPRYISSVDSGNLAGHLIAFKQACLELSQTELVNPHAHEGLKDSFNVLEGYIKKLQSTPGLPRSGSLKRLLLNLEVISSSLKDLSWEETLRSFNQSKKLLNDLIFEERPEVYPQILRWMDSITHQVSSYKRDEVIQDSQLIARLEKLAYISEQIAHGMDFKFLFDDERKIFSIGHNVTEGRLDNSYYDLLASESRLTSFFAISKGDVSQEHWFRLGRQLTSVVGSRALISWSATMFEYLMPLLVMKKYEGTLLDQTYESVVRRQIEYGHQRQIPWGVSEAGYNARDLQYNYQYGPFGIPGLGLKRGLRDELVISPYSTMLASVILPHEALANLELLEKMDVLGSYGFYESLDYTTERVPKNKKTVILHSYMAHHQGMSLVSLNNLINGPLMQNRFHADPRMKAIQLLLQERIPTGIQIVKPRAEETHLESFSSLSQNHHSRIYTDASLSTPRTQIISNGTYSLMMTSAGSGFSKCNDHLLGRFKEDPTQDNWGQFFYIHNLTQGKIWSAGQRPIECKPKRYEAIFSEDKVEIIREDFGILTQTECIVSSEDNVELRRVSLTNKSYNEVEIEVTSYLEVVLAKANDDLAHPAFSKLFIQTEFYKPVDALLAHRRPRSKTELAMWGFHTLSIDGEAIRPVQYETDRSRFIGRGRSVSDPIVMSNEIPLSNSVGAVLDPIFSLRRRVKIPAKQTVKLTYSTGQTNSRDETIRLAEKYHDVKVFLREINLGWVKAQIGLRHLNITMEKAHLYQRLGGRILYLAPYLRAQSQVQKLNKKQQTSLWAYGISGDLPILLTRISDEKDMVMVRELLRGHEYLRLKGLKIDLVILNEHATSYLQILQDELMRQILISGSHALLDKPGGIFIRRADLISEDDLNLLKSVARVSLYADKGTLAEQLKRRPHEPDLPEKFLPTAQRRDYPRTNLPLPELSFFNGLGGFTADGKEYLIHLKEEQWTPAPWINVIANRKDFGFLVSESGQGYTWSVNSRENRLSSWSNDPVSDTTSEALYLRDEESGSYWSPTPLPIRSAESYLIRHGQGYTQFDHVSHGISQELRTFVPLDDSVKIIQLKLKNLGLRTRHLSLTSYIEWVLGVNHSQSAPTLVTEWDAESSVLLARNSYNNEFAERVAFMAMSEKITSYTCDRKEFIGRNKTLSKPAAMTRKNLGSRSGGGLDPCGVIQTSFELAVNEEKEIIILIGQEASREKALDLANSYIVNSTVEQARVQIEKYWDKTLNTIEIKTPDSSMNMLTNRWLLYQTIACRVWARSAFYQSGGAFGFRDQLQDVMALVYSHPEMSRAHILLAASRQFPEGDVQHWWHPPTGRGVRTRFSDDLLWLPYVINFYLQVTGDQTILNEEVSFIESPLLSEGHDETYLEPKISSEKAPLMDHCLRAINRSLSLGNHGLPLMGSGDWNDGMNRVGNKGLGESVWLAWFLLKILHDFIPHCDPHHAQKYEAHSQKIKKAIEDHAWDGEWYLRAFFDDGQKMGSHLNSECKIDSIAQSWALLSGQGDPERAKIALNSVSKYLIDGPHLIVKLFTPPFDKGESDPGYIKGYVPGVRENGGQYTHAAIWTLMAYSALKDGDKAMELFSLINPINHSSTRSDSQLYKVEPYVIAADIYGLSPHVGRGGWSWYTGSASWMYRAAIESILGFKLEKNHLRIDPTIPKNWDGYQMIYRRGETEFHIQVFNHQNESSLTLDGKILDEQEFELVEDGQVHQLVVKIPLLKLLPLNSRSTMNLEYVPKF